MLAFYRKNPFTLDHIKHIQNIFQIQNIYHRKVGNFKRQQVINLRKVQEDSLKSTLSDNRPLSADNWTQIRNEILSNERHITEVNIDATIMGRCVPDGLLNVAKSYMNYLNEIKVEPNLATLGKYLQLFKNISENQAIMESEQKEIIEIYSKITKKSTTLDSITCESLIHALCLTDKWEKSLELLEMIKITSKPSTFVYSSLIGKAFEVNDEKLGWKLLKETIDMTGKAPKCEAFVSFIQNCERKSNVKEALSDMEDMLSFIAKNEFIVSQKVIAELHHFYTKAGFICKIVTINQRGKCFACRNHLNIARLNADEFKMLSENFLDRVLIRKNLFLKTNPEELKRFEEFIQETAPYDCVIDGLNVAFSGGTKKSPAVGAQSIASVVRYFTEKKKKTLVLGRKHMNKWPKQYMNYVRCNSDLFLTEDLSQDDPFLLYAALKSGPETDFCSRDLMRGHAYLLGPEIKSIFRRWQQEHQYHYDRSLISNEIIVKEPKKFSGQAQKTDNGNTWHIPFVDVYQSNPEESLELTKSWLCISSKL